jgi:SNF2 family DNA or RNA helicase
MEPLSPNGKGSIDAGLVLERAEHTDAFLEPDQVVGAAAAEIEEEGDHGRFECTFALGPGGTVALDAVDARSASRGLAGRRAPAKRPGKRVARQSPSKPPELSLAERLLLVLQPPLEALLEAQGLLEWHAPLYPYQYEGVRALIESEELLLADDMGLGKTIQTIAALRVLIHLRRVEQALIVAPASLLTQWRREFELWAPELRVEVARGFQWDRLKIWSSRAHVHIVSYETLRQDVDELRRYGPSSVQWDVVVLDEAQKIKNRTTRASVACKGLQRRRAWALTGTPLENHIDDLASIVEFLTPFSDGDEPAGLLEGPKLLARHRELQLRRKKEDVLHDLPSKSVNDIWLQLLPGQRKTYERAEHEGVVHLKELGKDITISHVLALIQRLKQICNICPTTGESAKLDDLNDRLEQLSEERQRALVFSQYTADEFGVRGVVKRLERFRPLAYHGGLSSQQKDQVIATFKNDSEHEALVLSLRAGGQGLNLQEATYVFHFDRWWNPAVERQAEDRAHRIGQKNAVTVYRYVCEQTIEERIDRILRDKQALFDELVDHVTIDPGRLLGEKEIFGLFGLTPPARRAGAAEETLAP